MTSMDWIFALPFFFTAPLGFLIGYLIWKYTIGPHS